MKNFEFKAKVPSRVMYEKRLKQLNPEFMGEDHQTDTYFKVETGRLKLREGNIENALIDYERADVAGAKQSNVHLFKCLPDAGLKEILQRHLPVSVVVKKHRRIYFIGNVKFHFDQVEGLGDFVEVEAIDREGNIPIEELRKQCDYYFNFLGLKKEMMIDKSYSDLLKKIQENK